MKYCMHCGSAMSDGAEFCGNCGKAVLGAKNKDSLDVTGKAKQEVKKTVGSMQSNVNSSHGSRTQERKERKINSVRELFVNPDEQEKAVIGNGYLSNMLHTGSLSKGFGVLTNRRFYFKGTCFSREGKHFMKSNQERTVDLQDITASGFIYTRLFLWFVISVVGLAVAIFLFGAIGFKPDGIVFFIPDIIFWLIYIFYKRTIYEVSFAGGSIAVKASSYGMKEIKAFDKKLRLAKDEYLSERKTVSNSGVF